jgi:hypothetical protein
LGPLERGNVNLYLTTFLILDLFLSSGEGKAVPTLWGPLERANHNEFIFLRTASSGMLRRVALVRTDVSEELSASLNSVTRIGKLGTTICKI